jgi:glycosyltransferase involved in cell wall biosynthesis
MIIGDSKFGGAALVVCSLMKMLRSRDIDVTLLATDPNILEIFKKESFSVWTFKGIQRAVNPFIDISALLRLTRALRGKYDIVHTHTTKGGAIGRLAAKLAGVPVILHTVHGFAFHEFSGKLKTHLICIVERILAKMCDKMIFVNNYDRIKAIEMGITSEDKAVTVYNGIDESRLVLGINTDRSRKLSELNLSDSSFLSVYVGRLAEQKGLRYLFEAIKIVNEEMPNCVINQVVVGDGELFRRCQEWVEQFGITDRVYFLGFRPDAICWTGAADLFVLSSLWEGHSITLLEAMACGRPIVATDIKGNRESIKDGYNGLLVEPANSKALARAIIKIISNPKLAKTLGEHARDTFAKRFTLERMIECGWQVYEGVLKEKGLVKK